MGKRTHLSSLRSALLFLIIIASSLFPLITFADTTTLSPNAVGNFDEWTLGAGSTKVNAVLSNDGDTSYISEATTGDRQTFTVPGASVPVGSAIGTVTINAVARKTGANIEINLIVARAGTTTTNNGNVIAFSSNSYETSTRPMTINPFTNAAWTASEVNSWNSGGNNIYFGVRHHATNNTQKDARVTQICVVVDYTPPTTTTTTTTTTTSTTTTTVPTIVTLVNFTAEADNNGKVTLTWETASEINNSGFNIYRARRKSGNYIQINNDTIDPRGDETSGATYSFEDTPPGNGTYYYKLEDVEYGGKKTMHGPVKVRVGYSAAHRR